MNCNATRIELSNNNATTVEFTVSSTPADGTAVAFSVPGLAISFTPTTTGGVATVVVPSVSGGTNDIFDATLQVGSNAAIAVDVLVVETNKDQAIGVTISDAGVSYCAPTGGGGTPTEPPIEYVYGESSILKQIKEDPAHVSFVGDSICNNGVTDFTTLFHGALFEWRPDAWKGAWFNTTAGGAGIQIAASQGTAAISRPGSGIAYVEDPDTGNLGYPPGNSYETSVYTKTRLSNSDATQDWALTFQFKYLSETSSIRGVSTDNSFFWRWPDGNAIFRDATGNQQLGKDGTEIEMAAQMIGNGTSGYSTALKSRIYETINSNQQQVAGYADYDLTDGSSYWADTINRSYSVSGDVPRASSSFNAMHIKDRNSNSADRQTIESVFWGTSAAGLEISYFGAGGWRTRNHFAPGQPITYAIELPNGQQQDQTDSWHYTTAALGGRMAALGTTHALVFIGMNDISGSPSRTGADTLTDLGVMLNNMRGQRPGIKFVVLTLYRCDADTSAMRTAKADFNAGVKTLAAAGSDIAVLDLNQYIVDRFGIVDQDNDAGQAAFSSSWLFDGVHPNQVGAAAMSSWIWSRVAESTGGVVSIQGQTGQVLLTASDFAPVPGAYTGQIEAAADKTYTIDPGAVSRRSITGFYIKSGSGTCTANLKVGANVVSTASVSTSSGDQTPLANTAVVPDGVITLVISSNSSATDVTFAVEYTS